MSQQINLASPLLLKPRYAFGLREIGLGVAIALAAMLVWSGYLGYRAGELEQQAVAIEARQAAAQQTLDQLTAHAARRASPLLTEQIKTAQAQIAQSEILLSAINATLEQTATGFASRMAALARSGFDGVWLTGLTLAHDHIELKGSVVEAGLLTTYLDRLGKQAAFAGTTFSGLTAVEPAAVRRPDETAGETPAHLDFTLSAGAPKPAGTGATP